MTVRVNRSRKKNCNVPYCDAHLGRRKRGPHLRAEIVPAAGPIEAVVYRALNVDGTREAWMRIYRDRCWSERTPLPRRPRKAWQEAVRRARAWVADRDGNPGMALPSGSPDRPLNVRARRTRTRARVSSNAA